MSDFEQFLTLNWTWGVDSANPTGRNHPVSPPPCVSTTDFMPSDSLTLLPFTVSLSACDFKGSALVFAHASLGVHLEQLLSRLPRLQIDRERAVWARLAFCLLPERFRLDRSQPENKLRVGVRAHVCVPASAVRSDHYGSISTPGSIVSQLLSPFILSSAATSN